MGRSRSRSPITDRGRWGDPDDRHGHRARGRSLELEDQRRRDRDRRDGRSRSRSRSRSPESHRGGFHGYKYGTDRDRGGRDRDRGWELRDQDLDRTRERGRDRGPHRDEDRRRDERHYERGRGRDEARDRSQGQDRERNDQENRPRQRSRSRSRSRSRDHDRGRHDSYHHGGDLPGTHAAGGVDGGGGGAGGGGAGGGGGDEPRQRRWRSPSPPPVRSLGGGDGGGRAGGGEEGLRGRGAWSNPPPPHLQPTGRGPLSSSLSTAPPPLGSIQRGTVHTIRPFGIFVALPGYRRHVMVHNTQVSDDLRFSRGDDEDAKMKALEFYFPKGEQVWVKITEVAPDDRNPAEVRVNGSLRVVDQTTGADLDPEGLLLAEQRAGDAAGGGRGRGGPETDEPPEVGSVHRAVVKRIEAYGVFVALEGYRRHGLVHTSQVSNYLSFTREDTDEQKKAELNGVVTVGEQIWVKVVEVAPDEGRGGFKIGCSIKLVNQAGGEDLDPSNTRYRPRDAPGRGPGGPAGIGSGVGEVGRDGKINWGHLAADIKLYVNEKTAAQYKLLEDEEPAPAPRPPGPPPPGPGGPGLPRSGPMGRGRGMVLPAWMTQQGAAGSSVAAAGIPTTPGSLPANQLPPSSKFELVGGRERDVDPSALLMDFIGGGGGGGSRITSIEEALAILETHGSGKESSKDKKKKKEKEKKDKKDKKKKKKNKKKSKKKSSGSHRQHGGGSSPSNGSSSSSGSGSDDEDKDSRRDRRR
ncbi:hypothetical protein Vafri_19629 [Volvox africanus]|uniref:S1 motif domain-containing protein n=1 Tax=Volvox africanus TaxID=51714 RepID=A0A8J4FCC2_9CHLO|nr:hypothetical protein Vafri_19629 [Volvox africanus]